MNRCVKYRERGVIMVWAVLALVALLGMAALTVDVSRLVSAAHTAQNTVDAAALAGASELPGSADAFHLATQYVAANNEDSAYQIEISGEQGFAYYGPGSSVPDYGELDQSKGRTDACMVRGQTQLDYIFAPVVGLDTAIVRRLAVARRRVRATGDYAIFAKNSSGTFGIKYDGNDSTIDGNIHSNSPISYTGNNLTVNGAAEYVDSYKFTGSGADIRDGFVESVVVDYPVDFGWDDFSATTTTLQSIRVRDSSVLLPSGRILVKKDIVVDGADCRAVDSLYMVEGNVFIKGPRFSFQRTTIVAQGRIIFDGPAVDGTPYENDVLLLSLSSATTALDFKGAGMRTEGIIFAPNGGVVFTASSSHLHRGPLMGQTVDIRGTGFRIVGGTPTGSPFIELRLIR